MNKTIPGSTVLVTGAGGSIGSALTKAIVGHTPQLLILLDNSEHSLYQIETDLTVNRVSVSNASVLGDICNKELISETLERFRPDIIYHAAAFKHVPLTERNPIAALQNNALGTNVLAQAARKHKVKRMIMVSTDKAVSPRSIMGASKRLAELALVRWSCEESRMTSIRLGNVYGTEGSVVRLFTQQILAGGPVTVTHTESARHFLKLQEAVDLILLASDLPAHTSLLIPHLGEPVKIIDLAYRMIEDAGFTANKEIPITFIGLRPGDKTTEDFASSDESVKRTEDPRLSRVESAEMHSARFDALMANLARSVDERDLFATLKTLRIMVPEYQPSEFLMRSLEGASA